MLTENKKKNRQSRSQNMIACSFYRYNPDGQDLFALAGLGGIALHAIALVEAVDTTSSINKFLLARVERVAGRTNFNMDVLHC